VAQAFIALKCASCGAQLEVYDDMDRFACSYCRTEMVVQRRGGTVALRHVTEAISRVQAGTDRTADELSLVRLERELKGALALDAQKSGGNIAVGCFVVAIALPVGGTLLVALFQLDSVGAKVTAVILAILFVLFGLFISKVQTADRKIRSVALARIADLRSEISDVQERLKARP
jgi:DNA-directed RNA polymerase subunit RPC12/RpoP